MGEAIEKYLDGWNALGGDLFMYFTLSSGYSKWGSWGLVEDITKTSPKYDAVLRVLNKPRAALTLGTPVGSEIKAGNFAASNRWDKKGVEKVNIEPNKWMQYAVRAPKAGTYMLTAYIRSGETAAANVLVNNRTNGIFQINPEAQTATTWVQLEAGFNVVRIAGNTGHFSLKSFIIQ
jgi:hypothetical protein